MNSSFVVVCGKNVKISSFLAKKKIKLKTLCYADMKEPQIVEFLCDLWIHHRQRVHTCVMCCEYLKRASFGTSKLMCDSVRHFDASQSIITLPRTQCEVSLKIIKTAEKE